MFKKLIDWCRFYLNNGLCIIPVNIEKQPLIKWKEFQERKSSIEEVKNWIREFKKFNIAIVCGRVSNNLVVLDIENEYFYRKFIEKLSEIDSVLAEILEKHTWIVKTGYKCPVCLGKIKYIEDEKVWQCLGVCKTKFTDSSSLQRGIHIYIRVVDPKDILRGKKIEGQVEYNGYSIKTEIIDVKGEGGYVLAPPSYHESGVHYEFTIDPTQVEITELMWNQYLDILKAVEKTVAELTGRKEIEDVKKIIEEQLKKKKGRKIEKLENWFYGQSFPIIGIENKVDEDVETAKHLCHPLCKICKELEDNVIEKIFTILKPFYIPGQRHNLLWSIESLLIKNCVNYYSIKKLVDKFIEYGRLKYGQEEENQRIYFVKWMFGLRGGEGGAMNEERKELVGKTQLIEIIANTLLNNLDLRRELIGKENISEDEVIKKAEEIVSTVLNLITFKNQLKQLDKIEIEKVSNLVSEYGVSVTPSISNIISNMYGIESTTLEIQSQNNEDYQNMDKNIENISSNGNKVETNESNLDSNLIIVSIVNSNGIYSRFDILTLPKFVAKKMKKYINLEVLENIDID